MRSHPKTRAAVLAAAALLALCGCSGAARPRESGSERAVSIAACFSREDGGSLSGGLVRLTAGGEQADYPLDGGELELAGLPRTGEAELVILDSQGQALGTVLLSISEGAVIDAAADEAGCVHITWKEDTAEISLLFVLAPDGAVSCALQLAQDGPQSS